MFYLYSSVFTPLFSLPPGLSAESSADVMGQPHHGHLCVTRPGHRAPDRSPAAQEAIWPQQASHLSHHDEEHFGSGSVPARHHLHSALRG